MHSRLILGTKISHRGLNLATAASSYLHNIAVVRIVMFRATSTTVAKFASRHYHHPSSNNAAFGIANNNNIVYSNIIDKQQQQQQQQQQRSMTILSKESKVEFAKQNYSSRLAQTGRPVSPHVTIYAFPACALLPESPYPSALSH